MPDLWSSIQSYFSTRLGEYLVCLWQHVSISFLSLMLALFIGIPCGILCVRYRKGKKWLVRIFQILRIVPSLAVLILLIPIMGTGIKPAMTALVLLAVPPILMNTANGLEEVQKFLLETATGLGMTGRQIFWRVKIPLAMPYMLTGARTAVIEIIASAAIAAKIGAGGLGQIIFTGLGLNRTDLLIIGGLSVALLSMLAGILFSLSERLFLPWKRQKRPQKRKIRENR